MTQTYKQINGTTWTYVTDLCEVNGRIPRKIFDFPPEMVVLEAAEKKASRKSKTRFTSRRKKYQYCPDRPVVGWLVARHGRL